MHEHYSQREREGERESVCVSTSHAEEAFHVEPIAAQGRNTLHQHVVDALLGEPAA
jgi:hypothetical protein